MKTSEILQKEISELDAYYQLEEGPPDPREEEFNGRLRRFEMQSVEGFLPASWMQVTQLMREDRGNLEWSLDDLYSRLLVKEVPRIVNRALKLEPLYAATPPSKPAETYLREATRAYLLGLNQASVALSRSALEQAMKERLRSQFPLLSETDELLGLLRAAERIQPRVLHPDMLQFGHDIRIAGNRVLHGEPCEEQAAFDCLIKTRKVLDALFGEKN